MTKISLKNVTKSYPSASGDSKVVLSNLSLDISDSLFITIIGPNGCGKTTLLNLIAGIIKPDSGIIEIQSQNGASPSVGYVWQDYRASLLPWLDVADNIAFPLRIHGKSREERRAVAKQILSEFNSSIDHRQKIYQLSGGQQQLVSILRSAVSNPDLLLYDEPLSALDQPTSWSMAFRIEQVWMSHKVPAVFVSHDVDEAVMLANQILLMSRELGKIKKVLYNDLPRPRNIKMLSSSEHMRLREEVIDFLSEEGALQDRFL
jgi:NitT/TauT family transport system ATP-binding protein